MIIKTFLLLAAALAALALASGCGGSDSSSASAEDITVETNSLSKKEFITRADSICKATRDQWNRDYAASIERNPPKPTKDAERAWLIELVEDKLIPDYQKVVTEISALGAPRGDEQEVTAFLKTFQRNLNAIQEKPQVLAETVTQFAKATALAKAYGANVCAASF